MLNKQDKPLPFVAAYFFKKLYQHLTLTTFLLKLKYILNNLKRS